MEQLDERAVLGAKFLDQELPDWFNRTNLATLQLRNGDRCVIAQATGLEFFESLKTLYPGLGVLDRMESARGHGFTAARGSWEEHQADWKILQESWEQLIRQRRMS